MTIDNKTIGLALSGGGYRATLFGLGSLLRLNEAGMLGLLDRITSVSGGSILAAILAHRWKELNFINGKSDNFTDIIMKPTREFCSRTIDCPAAIKGTLTPFKSRGDYLSDSYAKYLFGKTTLKEIPVAEPGNPKFIFYATSLQTGVSFRFRQDIIADYLLGTSENTEIPLATVVAASSAFPPVFSPIVLHTDPGAWKNPGEKDGRTLPNLDALRRRIVLADGGVYDNMGLESLVKNVDIALVSDAGAPFDIEEKPSESLFQLGRVRDIFMNQTRALRKRWFIADLQAGRKQGTYWGIGTNIADYKLPKTLATDSALSQSLDRVRTRLNCFEPELQGYLINWGYALCDAALRKHVNPNLPIGAGQPVPENKLP